MGAKKTLVCVLAALSIGVPSSTVSVQAAGSRDAPAARHPAVAAAASDSRHTTPRLTPSESALVVWARGRFAAAGLQSPAVSVEFTPGLDNCGGFQGRYYSATETIAVCVDDHAAEALVRTTLLHEMSHAWTQHHLNTAQRAAFVELRDTPTWDSWAFGWSDRATEHAAVVMAWGLMDIKTTVKPVGDTSRRALAESFRFLTGVDPINDGSVPSPDPTRTAVAATRLS